MVPLQRSQLSKVTLFRVTAARNHFHLGSLLEKSVLTKVTAILYSLLSAPWKGPCCSASGGPQIEWDRAIRQVPSASFPPLPRRNRPGDREKALAVLLPLVQREGPVAPDLYCMCGRVYKDMFFSSGFQDAGHREQAYHW